MPLKSRRRSFDESQQDRAIKSMLKQFKRLEFAHAKFNSKHNTITRSNMLRTHVLPFLRTLPALEAVFLPAAKIYLSMVSVLTAVLGAWWTSLLAALAAHIPTTDRNAYLECISRIMARREWRAADPDAARVFTRCLTDTLDYCMAKVSAMKAVPISMSAFVGKTFAYAYFHLPGVAGALLFLLNVKQLALEAHLAAVPPVSAAHRQAARSVFPAHLAPLADYRGLVLERAKRSSLNCMAAPKHPVDGIRDPLGPWLRRWCACESDIFNLFFRHYVAIADVHLAGADVPPEAFPGFHVVAAHMFLVFTICINRILATVRPLVVKDDKPAKDLAFPYKHNDSNYTCIIKLFKTIRDICYLAVPFSNHITRAVDQVLADVAATISLFDFNKSGLLLNVVYEFSNHVLDAAYINWEFWLGCSYLMITNTFHAQIISRNFAFLFNVWDKIPGYLSKVDKPHAHAHLGGWLKLDNDSYKLNFSNWLTSSEVWLVYFTHWNPLVRAHYLRLIVWRIIGINNYESSFSLQTTRRIKNKLDLVYDSVRTMLASKEMSASLANLSFAPDQPLVNRKFSVVPINSKFSYMDDVSSFMSVTTVSKSSDLRKTHPYEIFDEAVYTCTSLPSSLTAAGPQESQNLLLKLPRNHSLINSLGRFFKLLSTEESDKALYPIVPPNKILGDRNEGGMGKRSKSLTSLSTSQSMLRSSSPSLLSYLSSPNSSNDISTDSSVTSDSDSSSLLSDCLGSSSSTLSSDFSVNSQPPELFKAPPEIVRPIFKFDIVLDSEIASEKYMHMQHANNLARTSKFFGDSHLQNKSFETMPKPPMIPLVSIYLNSDIYNKFYITRDNYNLDDDVLSEHDAESLEAFSKDFARSICTPTDFMVIGKALNEWNQTVQEFETYLFNKVEADQANYFPVSSVESSSGASTINEIDELDYFKRIIPFMPIDTTTELKLLNAS